MRDCFRHATTQALCAAAGLFAVMVNGQADVASKLIEKTLQQAAGEPKEIATTRFVVSPVGRARP